MVKATSSASFSWRHISPKVALLAVGWLGFAFLAGMLVYQLGIHRLTGRHGEVGDSTADALRQAAWSQMLGERSLHASTAATGETFAMATGAVDSDVEGLFMLDFITGDLQCVVLNFRTGKFNAVFRTNVIQTLGIDEAKRPKYLMTTGMINFPRGATAARPGNSIVYVMDTSTGNYAAWGIPWRREIAATGRPQADALLLLDAGTARTAAIRE